ncbi:kita-kyushu lung cancer antigen 1 [Cricetulus griseus]|uniref:Kita-kyushu lung cancer antigen 1 n=1 Tax=Cricetulus griseus TaxID=10029 RepID=A0A9J7GN22_CRIGR|nr:kita-kyushu lung cancer antigen 1 [Cricetulus griseus]XP_027287732.1 kita-kyushu lung cancer antigen 1 [Cricetulus griseus]
MNILFILVGSIIFASIFSIFKVVFQIPDHERPSNPTSPTLLRANSFWSYRNTGLSFPGNSYNQDMMNNFPRTLALHKRILVNLNIMECQLTKLEQFLSSKNPQGHTKHRRRATVRIPMESDSGSNQ